MSIIITGASGFIGKNLTARLARDKVPVKCLVRRDSDLRDLNFNNIQYYRGDLLSTETLISLIADGDIVYYLAGAVGKHPPEEYFRINVSALENFTELCLGKVKKFVYLSTGSVVGQTMDKIIVENTPCRPATEYGKTKRQAELILLKLFEKKQFPVVIIRAPIVYGPYDSSETKDLSMIKLIKYISAGKFFIPGGGQGSKRSICYVGNLIEGMIKAAGSEKTNGQIYFLTDEQTYSLADLATAIAKVKKINFKVEHYPYLVAWLMALINEKISSRNGRFPQFNRRVVKAMTTDWICSSDKAKNEFGYQAKYGLAAALRETIGWHN